MKEKILDLFNQRVAEADPQFGPDYAEIAECVAAELGTDTKTVNQAVLDHETRFAGVA